MSLPCTRGSVPVAGGWPLFRPLPVPSVFSLGRPSVAGELGACTGSVGPVPEVEAAKATDDSSAAKVNAVSLLVIMSVASIFQNAYLILGLAGFGFVPRARRMV
ncbi:hypothetical protein EMIT043CA1_70113 [Pseudomonas brassicacearum]